VILFVPPRARSHGDSRVVGSQIRSVPSSPVEASQDPSEATANARTSGVWPVRVWRAVPVIGSQILYRAKTRHLRGDLEFPRYP
jgi:hypothetical protein